MTPGSQPCRVPGEPRLPMALGDAVAYLREVHRGTVRAHVLEVIVDALPVEPSDADLASIAADEVTDLQMRLARAVELLGSCRLDYSEAGSGEVEAFLESEGWTP